MPKLAERSAKFSTIRAGIYARISEDRFDEAEGVERQREACEKLAADRGIDVVAVFEDNDRSAMHGIRPGYLALLDAVRRGEIDAVIVLRTDRLYRQLRELVELTEAFRTTPVYSVRSGDVDLSNADGRLRANLMGAVAQHESEIKGERVSDAAEHRAIKGRFSGGQRRFGYKHRDMRTVFTHRSTGTVEIERPTGPLVLVPAEADAIAWAYKHVLHGGTLESVVREWRGRGLTGPQGARFSGVAVRDVLLRPMNAGLISYKGELLAGQADAPSIIDADVWHGVRAILNDPSRRTTVGRPPVSLLAPVLWCSVCLADPAQHGTGRINAKFRARRDGTKDLIYVCRERGHVSRGRDKLDKAIEQLVLAYLVENAAKLRRPVASESPNIAVAAREAEKLRDRLAAYHAMAADMEPLDFTRATKAIRAKLAEVDASYLPATSTPATSALVRSVDIPMKWGTMTTDQKRVVIMENVERIEIGRGTFGPGNNTMNNVDVKWMVTF